MVKPARVTIVIPNWNGKSLLEKNLPSVIAASGNKRNRITEIIIVDDASGDGSVDLIRRDYPKIRLFRHRINRGFSEAVNTGVRMARNELICLLNSDVEVTGAFLEPTLKHFKQEKVFAVSLREQKFGPAKGKFENGFVIFDGLKPSSKTSPSFWASGGSSIYSRKIWLKLKGMDSATFAPFYWEDVDLSYRALKRGYAVLWEPEASVFHRHEAIINNESFDARRLALIKERNQLLFIWKNITSSRFRRKHLRGLVRRLVRHPGYLRVVLAALGRWSIVRRAHKTEKREEVISDEAIFAQFE